MNVLENLNYVEIGKRIKNKRKELSLTQEKLAEIIDVSPSYVSEIERGTGISSLATINNIAQTLDLSLDYLIYGINVNNSNTTFSEILKTIPKNKQKLYISLCESIANTLKEN